MCTGLTALQTYPNHRHGVIESRARYNPDRHGPVSLPVKTTMKCLRAALSVIFAMTSLTALAADYPAPHQADFITKNFKFHTGEVMADLKLRYATLGEPSGQPVLVLHGTGGSAASMLTPAFAGELFGPGQPLDATKYFIIIPDALGHGKSAKPSDGLKTAFPQYNYDDMVEAQYRLVA